MSVSSDQSCSPALPAAPVRAAAEILTVDPQAADPAANVVVIRAAATLYVHPDTVVYQLGPMGEFTERHPAVPINPIRLRGKNRDRARAQARAPLRAASDSALAEVHQPLANGAGSDISRRRSRDSWSVTALIVNQHPLERQGLAAILRERVGLKDIFQADSGATGLTVARERRPGLAIIDLHLAASLPARELCAQLRALLAEARIILLTASERASEIRDCLMAGANGCLLKDTPEQDFAQSVQAVLRGKDMIDPEIAQKLASAFVGTVRGPSEPLTGREREVLDLLAEGYTNRQIANRLILAEPTVKGHVSRLFEKVSASSRLGVVMQARRVGLL